MSPTKSLYLLGGLGPYTNPYTSGVALAPTQIPIPLRWPWPLHNSLYLWGDLGPYTNPYTSGVALAFEKMLRGQTYLWPLTFCKLITKNSTNNFHIPSIIVTVLHFVIKITLTTRV